jgi:hypothetical protein
LPTCTRPKRYRSLAYRFGASNWLPMSRSYMAESAVDCVMIAALRARTDPAPTRHREPA